MRVLVSHSLISETALARKSEVSVGLYCRVSPSFVVFACVDLCRMIVLPTTVMSQR